MMDFLQPKGDGDPKVYWLRRGIVIGIPLLVVVILAATLWPRGTTTATNPTPSLSIPGLASPSPTALPSPSVPALAPASAPVNPSLPAAPPLPPAPTNCSGSDLYVSIDDASGLSFGNEQTLSLGIKNRGDQTCLLNLSGSNLTVSVVSGSDKIWTTAGCSKWVPTVKDARLTAGDGYSLKMSWPAKRSTGGCNLSNEKLGNGTYRIEASLAGGNTFKKSYCMGKC